MIIVSSLANDESDAILDGLWTEAGSYQADKQQEEKSPAEKHCVATSMHERRKN
jgi:hypothetical protein